MYTMEQIIEALQALNATNNTNAYASKFASSGSAYASRIRNSGSPLPVYIPAATALAGIVAVIVYYYRASTEEQVRTQKILERKQTGFFRPKRADPRTDREATRKLSAVQCLQIMEVLANATDEVTTLDKEDRDYNSDEEFPKDVAETVLIEPFKEHNGSENSSISSLSVSVDSEEKADKKTLHYDRESTPTNNRASNHDQSEPERQRYLADAFESQNENDESGEGSQSLVEPEGASIMSDDEGYMRQMGRAGSLDSFATVRVNHDPPRAFLAPSRRRSSWHGEDDDFKLFKTDRNRIEFENELISLSPQRTETNVKEAQGEVGPPRRRTTNKTPSRKPTKAPTFQPDGVIPPRRTSTKKSEVLATDPESSKAPGFTHGMMQAMAQYASQNREEEESSGQGYRRPQRRSRRYQGTRRV